MRKEVPEIGWGDFEIIPNKEPSILIIRYDWRNNSVLFIHNFNSEPREIKQCALVIVVFDNKRERMTIAFHRFLLELDTIYSQAKARAYRSTKR